MVVARVGLYRRTQKCEGSPVRIDIGNNLSESNIINFIVKHIQQACHSNPEVSEGEESLERMI